MLVTRDRPHVETYRRQPDDRWVIRDAAGLDAVLKLDPIGVELPLAEIYDGIDFAGGEPTISPAA